MRRSPVSIGELHAILDAEFSRARSPECKSCVTPYPIRRTPADEVSTNWFITSPEECPHRCVNLLGEIVARLMTEYELERSIFGSLR